MNSISTDEKKQETKNPILLKKAQNMTGFFIHLFWFLLVNSILIILSIINNAGVYGSIFTFFGWGIGIASHGFYVFVGSSLTEKIYKSLEEKQK